MVSVGVLSLLQGPTDWGMDQTGIKTDATIILSELQRRLQGTGNRFESRKSQSLVVAVWR